MNLSHLHPMKRWEFLTISIEEASEQKKAVSFYSMNASEAFPVDSVSNIGFSTGGAVQPFYYFLLTQSVDTSDSFVRSSV
jgi:hypothetical protein